jgi:hypothetical protein
LLILSAGLFALVATGSAQPPSDPKSAADLKSQQEQNAELFRRFQKDLLSLAQRMERSDRPEDKERAKVLYAALELARKENLESQFQKIIGAMARGTGNVQDLDAIIGQDEQLRKVLQEILTILMTDDEAARLKAEIARLEAFLKEAREIKRNQETIRAMTEGQKGDPNRIAKNQNNLAGRTRDLADQMAGKKGATAKKGGEKGGDKGGDGSGDERGIAKAEPKPESKPGETAGEGRSDTEQEKADAKPSDGGDGDPMKGGGDASEGRPGAKEGPDGTSAKSNPEPKVGEAGGQPRDSGMPKAGEGQPSGGKEGGGKEGSGQKAGGKEGSGQKAGGKEGSKAGQKDDGEPKPQGENKSQGQGKGEDKESKGQQAGDGKGTGSKDGGEPKGGSKGGGQPSGGQQGGGQLGGGQQQQQPQGDQTPGRKQVQEAYPHQKDAVEDLKKNERKEAGKKEDKAIEELTKAIQELEKRLKQLREEEMLKLLANLEARCNRMLAMQIEVYEATKAIDAVVQKNQGQKGTAEIQKSQQQGDKEGEIIVEADRTLKLLESEGTAVAFARVLEEVKQDMVAVQRRLSAAVVDKETQAIEENIISLLKEMVLALKKAQQDIQQQQNQPPPPPGQPRPNQQRLLDLIAELKLIRSLQVQVNSRTKMYGEKYQGEQAGDPLIQAELKQLSARQAKLQEMLNKIASGNNQ